MKRVHRLPEKMNFNQTAAFKTFQRKLNVFGHTTPFLLWKKALVLVNFHISLPLKRQLVTTRSETHALIFREYVAEGTKGNPEQFKPDEVFWFH